MYPLPCNPKVVIQTDTNGKPIRIASNIAPLPEIEVVVTAYPGEFEQAAAGTMFNQNIDPAQQ